MNEIVFLKSLKISEEPFTTHEIIADFAGIERESAMKLIRTYKKDLEEFGLIGYSIRKPPKNSKGGRPRKVYHLNEQQATLIITYLDNTPAVRKFKKELVRQFYQLKQEQLTRITERQTGKERHLMLTEAIKSSGISEKYYFHYMNLAYKTTLGSSAKKLREERGANKKSSPLDYLTSKELQSIAKREQEIAVLIGLGLDYERIKAILTSQGVIYQTTIQTPQNAN